MDLFIAGDGDGIGQRVGRAEIADNEEEVRRLSSAIESGNKLFQDWVLSTGGSMISYGGDEFSARVPVSRLMDLPQLRHEYEGLVGATISIGVGVKLSQAMRALLAAKLQGKNRIQLYTQEVEELLKENKPKTEAAKLDDEYGLGKSAPGLNEGGEHAGMKGPSHQSGAAKPTASQGDHEEGQVAQDYVEENAPGAPEMTHAAKDLAEQFHDLASEQGSKDQQTQAAGTSRDAAKNQVVKILTEMKGQTAVLEQLKQAAPEAYKTVVESVQAMLVMAKELSSEGQDPQHPKGTPVPEESKETKKSEKRVKLMGDALIEVDKDGHSLGNGPLNEDALKNEQNKKTCEVGSYWNDKKNECAKLSEDIEQVVKLANRFTKFAERVPKEKILQLAIKSHEGVASVLTKEGFTGLAEEHQAMAEKHKEAISKLEKDAEALDKGPMHLPMPHATAHPHFNLPSGSVKDGKVKVTHGNGQESWVSVRAGQVMSQDGHSISARNPSGK